MSSAIEARLTTGAFLGAKTPPLSKKSGESLPLTHQTKISIEKNEDLVLFRALFKNWIDAG